MKTAISVPDSVHNAVDRYARRRGLRRSQVYVLAAQRLLAEDEEDDFTASWNAVAEESKIEEGWARAAAETAAKHWDW
jgi:hypothetical protein